MVGCFERIRSAVQTLLDKNKPGEPEKIKSDDPQKKPVVEDDVNPNGPPVPDREKENPSRPNLWSKAYARLSEDIRLSDPFGKDLKDVHQNIQESLAQLREKTRSEQTKIKLLGGKEKPIQEIIAKTIEWIDKLVNLGRPATSLGATGGAGIAVGFVTLICEMLLEDQAKWELAMDQGPIAHLTYYYARVEDLFLSVDSNDKLSGSLITLYASVLHYQYAVWKYLKHSPLVAPFKSDDLQGLLNKVKQESQKVDDMIQLLRDECDKNVRQEFNELKQIERPIFSIQKQVAVIHDIQDEERKMKILDWVSNPQVLPGNIHETIQPQEGTCSWLLQHGTYIDWKTSEKPQSLWLKGKLGSGKTNLTAHVIRDLQQSIPHDMAYFYCSATIHRGEEPNSKADFICRALLRQLVDQSIPPSLEALYTKLHSQNSMIPSQDCLGLLKEINGARNITLVVDGLDELKNNVRDDLLESLSGNIGSFKIFASTRPSIASDVTTLLPLSRTIDTCDYNATDIESFVKKSVEDFIRRRKNHVGTTLDASAKRIQEVLIQKANGMFRWVQLTIQYMNSVIALNENQLLEQITPLPSELNNMYEKVFEFNQARLHDPNKELMYWVLIWLMYGEDNQIHTLQRLVSFLSYQFPALQESINEKSIMVLCPTLIEFHKATKEFKLAHFSVKEFLAQKKEYMPQVAHGRIAQFALQAIINHPINGKYYSLGAYPKPIHYSLSHWHTHCVKAKGKKSQNLKREVADALVDFHVQGGYRKYISSIFRLWLFLDVPPSFQSLAGKIHSGLVLPDKTLALFIGSYFGLQDLVDHCLDKEDTDVNSRVGRRGFSAVMFACAGNQRSMVEHFIHDRGAKEDSGSQNSLFYVALENAEIGLFQMIYDRGCVIDLENITSYLESARGKYGLLFPDLCKKLQLLANGWKRIDFGAAIELIAAAIESCEVDMDDMILDLLSREIEVTGDIITFTEKRGLDKINRERLLSGSNLTLESHAVERILTECLRLASTSQMELLIQQEFDAWPIEVSQNLLLAALGNISSYSTTMIPFFLTRSPYLRLSGEVLLEVMRLGYRDDKLLNILLDHDRELRIKSQEFLKEALSLFLFYSRCQRETMQRMLDRCEGLIVDHNILDYPGEREESKKFEIFKFLLEMFQRSRIRVEGKGLLADYTVEDLERIAEDWVDRYNNAKLLRHQQLLSSV